MPRLAWATILGVAALAGCRPQSGSGPAPAALRDLKLSLVAEAPAGGGLPAKFTLVVTNASARPVRFTEPRPMCAEAESEAPPFPILGIGFRECKGLYWPMYTDLRATRVPTAVSTILAPGQRWTREYSLKNFYFWGPCGPASAVDIRDSYRPGKTGLHMFAILAFAPARQEEQEEVESGPLPMVESASMTVRCSVEGEMLDTEGKP